MGGVKKIIFFDRGPIGQIRAFGHKATACQAFFFFFLERFKKLNFGW